MNAIDKAINEMKKYAVVSPSVTDPLMIARATLSGTYTWLGNVDPRYSKRPVFSLNQFKMNMVQ